MGQVHLLRLFARHHNHDHPKQNAQNDQHLPVRHPIRNYLVKEQVDHNSLVAGTLTTVYDHDHPNLSEKLIGIQHQGGGKVLTTMHAHLDHNNYLRVVAMKGCSGEMRELADGNLRLRGVNHGQLVMTGKGLKKDLLPDMWRQTR